MEDIGIILQGYSKSKDQLIELVKYYKSLGFTKIIASTYLHCVSDELKKLCRIVINDIHDPKKVPKGQFLYSVPLKRTKTTMHVLFDEQIYVIPHKLNKDKKLQKYELLSRSLNCHLLTTKKGIHMANIKFNNTKYYLKIRADTRIDDLDKVVNSWKKQLCDKKNELNFDTIYTNKLITFRTNIADRPYYNTDYFLFGLKEDITNYYNIPFIKDTKSNTSYNYLFNISYQALVERYFASSYISNFLRDISSQLLNNDDYIKHFFIQDSSIYIYWYSTEKYIFHSPKIN
jgi:hypothetical protein